jgi:hypothetical protein
VARYAGFGTIRQGGSEVGVTVVYRSVVGADGAREWSGSFQVPYGGQNLTAGPAELALTGGDEADIVIETVTRTPDGWEAIFTGDGPPPGGM